MAMKVGELYGVLTLNKSKFDKGLKASRLSFGAFAKVIKLGAIAIGVALVAVGVAATKLAVDFQKGMANIHTLLGSGSETEARIKELGEDVKTLSFETGKSLDDLTGGLYQVVSAFGDTADSAEILRIAAMGSSAGLATTSDAVNLLSAVTKGYGDTSAEAVMQVSDLAFQTVKLGQTTYPELAASIGKVVPGAKALKVSQEELFAVTATLTGVTGNTAEVMTQLQGIMISFQKPNKQMKAALKELGFTGANAGKKLIKKKGGLVPALEALADTSVASKEGMAKILGKAPALNAALQLTGSSAEVFQEKLDKMNEAQGSTTEAFGIQQQTVSAMWGRISAALSIILVNLGEKFLPLLEEILDWILENLPQWMATFEEVFGAIGGFIDDVIETLQGLLSPAEDAEGGVSNIGKAIDDIVKNIWPAFKAVFEVYEKTIAPLFVGAAQLVIDIVDDIFESFYTIIDTAGPSLEKIINFLTDKVFPPFQDLLEWLTDEVFPLLGEAFDDITDVVAPALGEAFNFIADEVLPHLETAIDFVTETVIPALRTIMDKAKETVDLVWPHIQTIIEKVMTAVQTAIEIASPFIDGLGSAFTTVKDMATEAFNGIKRVWNGLAGFFSRVWNNATAAIKRAINKIIDMLNGISKAFAFKIQFDLPSFDIPDPTQLLEGGKIKVGGGSVNWSRGPLFDPIEHFAKGTRNAPGGMAILGERGPELAYIPQGAGVLTASETRDFLSGSRAAPGGPAVGTQNIYGVQPGDVERETRRALRRQSMEWSMEGRR